MDSKYANTIPLNSISLANADVNINNHKLTNVSSGILANDASTLSNRLDQFANPSSVLAYSV